MNRVINGIVTRKKMKIGSHGYNYHSYYGITVQCSINGKVWFSTSAKWVNDLREGDRIIGTMEEKEQGNGIIFGRKFKLEKRIGSDINEIVDNVL